MRAKPSKGNVSFENIPAGGQTCVCDVPKMKGNHQIGWNERTTAIPISTYVVAARILSGLLMLPNVQIVMVSFEPANIWPAAVGGLSVVDQRSDYRRPPRERDG
jgi:hypothetical protein